jgi:branched-subunit amino acid aminotransferase/4-amino-4-deoxychorismate lyase
MTDKPSGSASDQIPTVPTDDRGLLLGDGLFATLIAINGTLQDFEAHYQRLMEGCEAVDLPLIGREDMQRVCSEAVNLQASSQTDLVVRFTLTAGSGGRGLMRPEALHLRAFARAFDRPRPPAHLSLGLAMIRRNEFSPTSRHKTLNYLDNVLARAAAVRRGFDDALMLNTKGEVACISAGNLFWFEDGCLITPALACGVRDGVMRHRVIEAARALRIDVKETFHTLRPGDLDAAPVPAHAPYSLTGRRDAPAGLFTGAFVCNSVMGVVPVSKIGALIPGPHPAFGALKQKL